MTKDEILERYLNTVYLGNGAYGVQAGAETYFGMGVCRDRRRPVRVPRRADRQPEPLRPDPRPGGLAGPARPGAPPAGRRGPPHRRGGRLHRGVAPIPTVINQVNPDTQDYFVEEVKQALFDDPRLGTTREERQNRVFRGGLRIYTTLDPRAQAMATAARNDVLAGRRVLVACAGHRLVDLGAAGGGPRRVRRRPGADGRRDVLVAVPTVPARRTGATRAQFVRTGRLGRDIVPR